MFRALEKLSLVRAKGECEYSRAGRTDKGVSAVGNVISLLVRVSAGSSSELEAERINRLLPEDIRVTGQCEVGRDFSARYNCIRRVYKYFFFRELMDIEKMREVVIDI